QAAATAGTGGQACNPPLAVSVTDALRVEWIALADADGVRRALLAAHVDLRGRILADQDDRERRRDAARLLQALDPGGDVGEDALLDGLAGEDHAGTRRRRISVARPGSGSIAIATPCRAAGPFAGSNRTGIWVRKRCRITSRSTPMTPSVGPVMPRSVM